ncbi:hypothetical protein [Micromonospora sp. NPDC049102]|uniref:hypothetical protein n=1 Tax=Micromonospora sp. NPDC049102 TaxID=3364265 RepID=UPI003720EAE7
MSDFYAVCARTATSSLRRRGRLKEGSAVVTLPTLALAQRPESEEQPTMSDPFPSGAPTSYDDALSVLSVDPGAIYQVAHVEMVAELDEIVKCWNRIGSAWSDLKLGWAGESASAAEDFNRRLDNVQAELFGVDDKKDPKPGIFGLIRGVAVQAASNYDGTENQIFRMFQQFANNLESASGGDAPPQGSDANPIKISYGNS